MPWIWLNNWRRREDACSQLRNVLRTIAQTDIKIGLRNVTIPQPTDPLYSTTARWYVDGNCHLFICVLALPEKHVRNKIWVVVANDVLVTREVIGQWFALVTTSSEKLWRFYRLTPNLIKARMIRLTYLWLHCTRASTVYIPCTR